MTDPSTGDIDHVTTTTADMVVEVADDDLTLAKTRSRLTRQPVLTQHYRRHVVVAKTTSLPQQSRDPVTPRY